MIDAAHSGVLEDARFLPGNEPPVPEGAGGSPPPGRRRVRFVLRWAWHVVFVAAWMVILLTGALTWLPKATDLRTDIIIGPSMEPTIPLYSVIVVEEIDPASVRKGDIITFQQPGMPERKVTHRVSAIEKSKTGRIGFITKGDNNRVRDPWRVEYADTAYRVRTHVPHVGWLMRKAQTREARMLLIVLPVLILLVQFLRWLWRSPDEDGVEGTCEADQAYAEWYESREAA